MGNRCDKSRGVLRLLLLVLAMGAPGCNFPGVSRNPFANMSSQDLGRLVGIAGQAGAGLTSSAGSGGAAVSSGPSQTLPTSTNPGVERTVPKGV